MVLELRRFARAADRRLEQTQSEAFKRWFGRSKLVDAQGLPKVVFHGTKAPDDFGVFGAGELIGTEDDEILRSGSGHDPMTFLGSHFALEAEVADRFAEGLYGEREGRAYEGGRVYPVFLRLENPFHAREEDLIETMMQGNYRASAVDYILEGKPDGAGKRYDADPAYRVKINEAALALDQRGDENGDFTPELAMEMAWKLREDLRSQGHDGIIYGNAREGGTSVVVFDAGQIKSAIGNGGHFDPSDPDIRR